MRCITIFPEPVGKVAGHRILALNRGEKEKILTGVGGSAGAGDPGVADPAGGDEEKPLYRGDSEGGSGRQLQAPDCSGHREGDPK